MEVRLGIDFGSTLVKTVAESSNGIIISCTKGDYRSAISDLQTYNVSDVYFTGIGHGKDKIRESLASDFPSVRIHESPAGDIETELLYQVKGLQDALVIDKIPNPRSYYLVSIGTGTSYTAVKDDVPSILPYGSAFGGGVIYNLGYLLSIGSGMMRHSISNFNRLGSSVVLDTFSTELIPEDQMVNDPNKVISHFNGLFNIPFNKNDLFETLVHMVGYTIVQELMMQLGGKPELKTAVCIGTTLTTFGKRLIPHLEKYFKMYGVDLITLSPELSAYVGALGALHIP